MKHKKYDRPPEAHRPQGVMLKTKDLKQESIIFKVGYWIGSASNCNVEISDCTKEEMGRVKHPVHHRPCANGLSDPGAADWSSECSDFPLSQIILQK